MKTFNILLKRNVKLFFKDKGMFFTSLITPLILLVLYATFLANVYKSSFLTSLESSGIINVPERIIDGLVGGQLVSSLLAVSTVTVSFCSNMLMVQDKVTGAHQDLLITPVKRSQLAFSYYLATTISTLIICLIAYGASLIYVSAIGWYMTFSDALLLLVDVLMLTTFGTALSSVINYFLSSQGQISAVGSIVSSCYGFICGAYMPLASFSEGLRKVLMFLPGTYGTNLLRIHATRGAFDELAQTIPSEAVSSLADSIDANLYFFGNKVSELAGYLVLIGTIIMLIGVYVLINVMASKRKSK